MADQPNRRRSALAEIPVRMSQLRVSTDDMPAALGRTVIDSPLDNIPIGYLTPSPSQDEIIIRQRGRRRISLNWSPEKNSNSAIVRTPTKSTITMTLRSSPRKRLYNPDGSCILMSPFRSDKQQTQSPRRTNRFLTSLSADYTPQTKRLRIADIPMSQRNEKTPLNKILKGLTNNQLIQIIQTLVNNEPGLETKIRSNLPMPDIKPMEEPLATLKKNIFKSLPTSRLVKSTDSVSYSRASTHLAAFKKAIVDQSRVLNDSEHWDALLDYCLMAWNFVRATPVWDNTSHNAMRRNCFKILSWQCLTALKTGGIYLGESRLIEFYSRIQNMKDDCDDIGSCQIYLDDLLEKLNDTNLVYENGLSIANGT